MGEPLAEPYDPLVGTTVADRFVIEGKIGSGGMGTVYRATQMGLDRAVALKLLKDEVSWDPDTITRFHREAKAMSLLVHPNTVRVFDFGQTPTGTLFLAMEMLEGELLTTKLEREGALSATDAIHVVTQILASLHEAHAKGIIHRDLKPDNIFLADVEGHHEPVVKVLDFGIAKVFEGENQFDQLETQKGTVFGTPRYMSPEQAQGKPMDARSDLYSVGVLLYQLITGLPPFRDDDAVVVMAKHIRDAPERPSKAAPGVRIPPKLEKAVLKALEKTQDKRFRDADAFRVALDSCLDESGRASHTGVFSRGSLGGSDKWPWFAGAGLVLLAFVLVSWWVLRDPAPAPVVLAEPPTEPTLIIPDDDIAVESHDLPEIGTATLLSDPAGAEVWDGDRLLGTTPLRYDLDVSDRREVEVRRDGFETATAILAANEEYSVELHGVPETTMATRMTSMRVVRMTMSETMTEEASAMMAEDPYTRFD